MKQIWEKLLIPSSVPRTRQCAYILLIVVALRTAERLWEISFNAFNITSYSKPSGCLFGKVKQLIFRLFLSGTSLFSINYKYFSTPTDVLYLRFIPVDYWQTFLVFAAFLYAYRCKLPRPEEEGMEEYTSCLRLPVS